MIFIDKDPKGIFITTNKITCLQTFYTDFQVNFNSKAHPNIAKEIILSPYTKSEIKYLEIYDGNRIKEQLLSIGRKIKDIYQRDIFVENEILEFTKCWGFIRLEDYWLTREGYWGMPIYEFKNYAQYFRKIYNIWISIRSSDIYKLRQKITFQENPVYQNLRKRIQVLFDGDPRGHPIKENSTEEEIIKHVIEHLSPSVEYDNNEIERLKQTTDKQTFEFIMKYQPRDYSIDNYPTDEIKELKKHITTRPYCTKVKNEILFNGDYISDYKETELTDNDVIEIAQLWIMKKVNPIIRIRYELLHFKNSFKLKFRAEDILTLVYFSLYHEMTGEGVRPRECKNCGVVFTPRKNNILYCSKLCKSQYKNKNQYERELARKRGN